ncbi:MAG: Jag N-terminal domain-containing protein [Armatimonadetes bacterium]|nr:Jag N-terminal domain-containing protein [Armatimonadota bacterium]
MQTAVATGKTLEEAQAAALAELGVSADEVQFETLEEPRKVLGFSTGEYKVQATVTGGEADAPAEGPAGLRDDEAEEPLGAPPVQPIANLEGQGGDATQEVIAQRAVEFLTETTRLMGLKTDVVVVGQEEGEIEVEIRGQGLGMLIGRHGATLDALQMLAAVVANSGFEKGARVVVDAEKYRERRREMLVEMAHQQADKAKESQQEVVIPDLKPFERRIIHLTLVDDPEVETYSEGEGDDRCIVISPRNG